MKKTFILAICLLVCWPVWALFAPDNDYDVYLLIGQSNMAGRGTMTGQDTLQPIRGVYLLNEKGEPEEAVAPLNKYSTIRKDISQQQIGLGYSFAQMMHSWTGRKILLVVNARGGSSIKHWAPDNSSHAYLDSAIVRTRQALNYGELKGILWHQGETDVEKNISPQSYSTTFVNMMQSLQTQLNVTNIPILVGELGQWEWHDMSAIQQFNDSTLSLICQSIPTCHKVHSDNLKRLYRNKPSDPHFSRSAQLELGQRYAEKMLPLVSDIYVTPFRDGKRAGISFTYDDGLLEHYNLVAPELEKRGFKGTFWIIGSVIGKTDIKNGDRLTWQQCKELSDRGHEISNHSWSHPNLTRISQDSVLTEILRNDSAIEAATGKRPITFCYPYNAFNDKVLRMCSNRRVGTRTRQIGHGQQNNKTTAEKMTHWLNYIIEQGDWGVTMTHAIRDGYDKWYHPELLWAFYDEVKAKENDVWVGTFAEIATYQAERDAVQLRIRKGKHSYLIRPALPLDERLFDCPLTLRINGDWEGKNIQARQGRTDIPIQNHGSYLLLNFDPAGRRIRIHWEP